MIANPASSLNTALRGGACALSQPVTPSPAARSDADAAPASSEFSRMLERNQAAARQTQAATQARHAEHGAAKTSAGQPTPRAPSAPVTASPRERAFTHRDQADTSATDPSAAPSEASRNARQSRARDQTGSVRAARADTGEPADATTSTDAAACDSEDAVSAGMPVLPAVPPPMSTVVGDANGAAGDALDASRANAGSDAATAGLGDGQLSGREAGSAVRADGVPSGDVAVPAASTDSAATAESGAVVAKAGAGRDQPVSLPTARELSERTAQAHEATPDAALAALARSALSELTHRTSTGGDATSPTAFGMALANVQSARAGEVSAPVSAQASVATPLTDPGFQQALGYQISLFARDGIGQAELHLNPTDMGPVSVQITMTGDQARVDFGADLAQTRQLIEAGWAELASSLKDAGFTLSGGGVSDHARERQAQQGQGAAQSFGGRPGRDSGEASAVAPVVARRVNGGVDVYA